MTTEQFQVNGKDYTLEIEPCGYGGKVTVLHDTKVLPITYSISIEVARDFSLGDLKGYTGALDHLVIIAKDDLARGVQG